jgi:exonuclease 3'-5' domain-containing protein 1
MELACRTSRERVLGSLSKCIEISGTSTLSERRRWLGIKEKGLKLFAPERGGSHEVFNQRPLDDNIKAYCVQDVQFLPRLWLIYDSKVTHKWRKKVQDETENKITLSHSPSFNGRGRHMVSGPW